MKVKKANSDDERQILISMVVDNQALAHISRIWTGRGPFRSAYCNLVGGWCIDHYRKYQTAPGSQIEAIAQKWADESHNEALVRIVDGFLGALGQEYQQARNTQFDLDRAGELFNRVRLQRLVEDLENQIDTGKVSEALESVQTFRRVQVGQGSWVDPLENTHLLGQALEKAEDSIIRFPGDLQEFFGSTLQRDGFVAFVAPEKRGKSMWLQEMVIRSLESRLRTAYFVVGDMSQDQMFRRLAIRITRTPLRAGTVQYPVTIDPPLQLGDPPYVETKPKSFSEGLTRSRINDVVGRYQRSRLKRKGLLRAVVAPIATVSVVDIDVMLQDWQQMDNWAPDVVVIDYADILAHIPGSGEGRDRINASWMALRKMSQERHCLVITASQSDAASYTSKSISMKNFSDDKRKWSHVTGAVSINATDEEKSVRSYRLEWILRREEEASPPVWTASCLSIGCPAVRNVMFRGENP